MAASRGNKVVDTIEVTATATLTKSYLGQLDGTLAGAGEYGYPILSDAVSTDKATLQIAGMASVIAGSAGCTIGVEVVADSAGLAVDVTALSATVPGSGTTVTSSSAQPAMTLAGGGLPQKVLGIALNTAASGEYVNYYIR